MLWKGEGGAEGMIALAMELGNPGKHPVLWGQGLISLRHPSRSVSPRNRQLESSQILRSYATGLL